MIDQLLLVIAAAQGWLFETAVQPALYALGLNRYGEMVYDALETPLFGLLQITLIFAILWPLEKLRPHERWDDRGPVASDVIYTFLYHLGIVPLVLYFVFVQARLALDQALSWYGVVPVGIDQAIPALAAWPLATFLIYVAIFDFVEYWRHRMQHRFTWWWLLHRLHHDQRQLTFWADDRNHFLDAMLRYLILTGIGLAIGSSPTQFVGVALLFGFVDSLTHVNSRVSFGRIGARMLVSPLYHRTHHAIELPQVGPNLGCNFAVLLPLWDILFGTANFQRAYLPTGVSDEAEHGRSGESIWQQQTHGLRLLWRHLRGGRPASRAAE